MLEHKYLDFGIRCTMANLSDHHLNLRCNDIIISLRYFMKVPHKMILTLSRIPFWVFKLSRAKLFWYMQLVLNVYLFQWLSVHSLPVD